MFVTKYMRAELFGKPKLIELYELEQEKNKLLEAKLTAENFGKQRLIEGVEHLKNENLNFREEIEELTLRVKLLEIDRKKMLYYKKDSETKLAQLSIWALTKCRGLNQFRRRKRNIAESSTQTSGLLPSSAESSTQTGIYVTLPPSVIYAESSTQTALPPSVSYATTASTQTDIPSHDSSTQTNTPGQKQQKEAAAIRPVLAELSTQTDITYHLSATTGTQTDPPSTTTTSAQTDLASFDNVETQTDKPLGKWQKFKLRIVNFFHI